MKDNKSLYFDIWRKREFRALLRVYTQTANQFKTQEEMILGFGKMLDRYVEGGHQKYIGTKKQWSSAYTLGRELGVFRSKIGESYELSRIAKSFLESKILGSEYLLLYLLNLNQLIGGKLVHPFYEVLMVVKQNGGQITKNNVKNIPQFRLSQIKQDNQRQIVNVFFHRMVEAQVIEATSEKDTYRITSRYSLDQLIKNCYIINKLPEENERMQHEEYVDMLSTLNPLVPTYK
ncbi:hypothetical protein [Alkalicoccobacillus plakortidis]|uniref:Uncharacterized protein n=1 Tax=Alkalicoccobacillus plakortidis TaxID=444060 RepID=A0ABT0XKI5_9BACI|nr:hypothetical protein [Alkalicoccobacillus plakortidis]MCM2676414.1 hypothetical protein [Alkalicoccobacillus plakortidis]